MTELERLALLGDKKAQERLTELRIPIRCPLCGNPVVLMEVEPHSEKLGWIEYKYEGSAFLTCSCGYAISGENKEDVIRKHNSRPAPPIGRCKDCLHYFQMECLKIYDDGNASADARQERKPDDFCSYFEPKENANE